MAGAERTSVVVIDWRFGLVLIVCLPLIGLEILSCLLLAKLLLSS